MSNPKISLPELVDRINVFAKRDPFYIAGTYAAIAPEGRSEEWPLGIKFHHRGGAGIRALAEAQQTVLESFDLETD